ncbi:hypothetical protein Cme02nite_50220 [Catellatospora methionotrophica]|uniref:BioF2-like acetyltransferase domain-containing protein n=1 Tax=Catellatospora methionotrophica TaxID=121620 RepID=A0A8J3LLB3_9ACTN|nr:GNAT family N-acetyltransferase [Catellatospora methionotrophica]GIG16690.1 hypothetical protein Cme02nite_50220 [Catellatospora methionotrophica]
MSTTIAAGIRVYSRADDLPAEQVRLLTADGRLYDSPGWLRYCESSAGGALRYLTLSDDTGRLIGLSSLRLVPDRRVLRLYDLSTLVGMEQSPEALFPNGVAAVSGAHCVLLPAGHLGPQERARVRGRLARATADLAEQESCRAVGFLYLDDLQAAQDVADALQAGPPFLAAAQTVLVRDWSDFDGYLATLHKGRRTNIRRERRQFAESGLRVRVLHGTAGLDERTARLQLAVRRRYSAPGSVESILADYGHLGRTVDDQVRVFLCERDGVPVGLSLALLDGDRLHLRLVGFDYEATGADFAYFNMLFYEPIQWGIDNGVAEFSFGSGSYPAKLARGCRPVPTYGVVRWPDELREQAQRRVAERADALRAELGLPLAPHPTERGAAS